MRDFWIDFSGYCKIAADEKKRAEKKALAEANKGLKELRKIDITPKGE